MRPQRADIPLSFTAPRDLVATVRSAAIGSPQPSFPEQMGPVGQTVGLIPLRESGTREETCLGAESVLRKGR